MYEKFFWEMGNREMRQKQGEISQCVMCIIIPTVMLYCRLLLKNRNKILKCFLKVCYTHIHKQRKG